MSSSPNDKPHGEGSSLNLLLKKGSSSDNRRKIVYRPSPNPHAPTFVNDEGETDISESPSSLNNNKSITLESIEETFEGSEDDSSNKAFTPEKTPKNKVSRMNPNSRSTSKKENGKSEHSIEPIHCSLKDMADNLSPNPVCADINDNPDEDTGIVIPMPLNEKMIDDDDNDENTSSNFSPIPPLRRSRRLSQFNPLSSLDNSNSSQDNDDQSGEADEVQLNTVKRKSTPRKPVRPNSDLATSLTGAGRRRSGVTSVALKANTDSVSVENKKDTSSDNSPPVKSGVSTKVKTRVATPMNKRSSRRTVPVDDEENMSQTKPLKTETKNIVENLVIPDPEGFEYVDEEGNEIVDDEDVTKASTRLKSLTKMRTAPERMKTPSKSTSSKPSAILRRSPRRGGVGLMLQNSDDEEVSNKSVKSRKATPRISRTLSRTNSSSLPLPLESTEKSDSTSSTDSSSLKRRRDKTEVENKEDDSSVGSKKTGVKSRTLTVTPTRRRTRSSRIREESPSELSDREEVVVEKKQSTKRVGVTALSQMVYRSDSSSTDRASSSQDSELPVVDDIPIVKKPRSRSELDEEENQMVNLSVASGPSRDVEEEGFVDEEREERYEREDRGSDSDNDTSLNNSVGNVVKTLFDDSMESFSNTSYNNNVSFDTPSVPSSFFKSESPASRSSVSAIPQPDFSSTTMADMDDTESLSQSKTSAPSLPTSLLPLPVPSSGHSKPFLPLPLPLPVPVPAPCDNNSQFSPSFDDFSYESQDANSLNSSHSHSQSQSPSLSASFSLSPTSLNISNNNLNISATRAPFDGDDMDEVYPADEHEYHSQNDTVSTYMNQGELDRVAHSKFSALRAAKIEKWSRFQSIDDFTQVDLDEEEDDEHDFMNDSVLLEQYNPDMEPSSIEGFYDAIHDTVVCPATQQTYYLRGTGDDAYYSKQPTKNVQTVAKWHQLSFGLNNPTFKEASDFPPCIKEYKSWYSNEKNIYNPNQLLKNTGVSQKPLPLNRMRSNVRFCNVSVCEHAVFPDWGKVPCDDSEKYSIGLCPMYNICYTRTIDDYEVWLSKKRHDSASGLSEDKRRYAWIETYNCITQYIVSRDNYSNGIDDGNGEDEVMKILDRVAKQLSQGNVDVSLFSKKDNNIVIKVDPYSLKMKSTSLPSSHDVSTVRVVPTEGLESDSFYPLDYLRLFFFSEDVEYLGLEHHHPNFEFGSPMSCVTPTLDLDTESSSEDGVSYGHVSYQESAEEYDIEEIIEETDYLHLPELYLSLQHKQLTQSSIIHISTFPDKLLTPNATASLNVIRRNMKLYRRLQKFNVLLNSGIYDTQSNQPFNSSQFTNHLDSYKLTLNHVVFPAGDLPIIPLPKYLPLRSYNGLFPMYRLISLRGGWCRLESDLETFVFHVQDDNMFSAMSHINLPRFILFQKACKWAVTNQTKYLIPFYQYVFTGKKYAGFVYTDAEYRDLCKERLLKKTYLQLKKQARLAHRNALEKTEESEMKTIDFKPLSIFDLDSVQMPIFKHERECSTFIIESIYWDTYNYVTTCIDESNRIIVDCAANHNLEEERGVFRGGAGDRYGKLIESLTIPNITITPDNIDPTIRISTDDIRVFNKHRLFQPLLAVQHESDVMDDQHELTSHDVVDYESMYKTAVALDDGLCVDESNNTYYLPFSFDYFTDIYDLTHIRKSRRVVGCNCKGVKGCDLMYASDDEHEHEDSDDNSIQPMALACECEIEGINCMADVCHCMAETCRNIHGRYEFDDQKVVNFTHKTVRMANKNIQIYSMWAKAQEHKKMNPSHSPKSTHSLSAPSSIYDIINGDKEPEYYGIPPLRADAVRVKLNRTLPPSKTRIPKHNILHCLPPENVMSWRQEDYSS